MTHKDYSQRVSCSQLNSSDICTETRQALLFKLPLGSCVASAGALGSFVDSHADEEAAMQLEAADSSLHHTNQESLIASGWGRSNAADDPEHSASWGATGHRFAGRRSCTHHAGK